MIDLKELMEERSAQGTPARGRLAEIQHRIRVRRRRRAVVGAATAVAALAGAGAFVTVLGDQPTRSAPFAAGSATPSAGQPTAGPPAVPSPVAGRKVGPFAEYARGYRVVAAGRAPVSAKKVQLTWTVASTDVRFFSYCPGLSGKHVSLDAEIAINGEPTGVFMNCISELHQDPIRSEAPVSGLSIGDTVTVTYTVTGAQDNGRRLGTIPTRGTLHFAVAEKVPFTAYPLPSRPAALKPPKPDGMADEPGTRVLHSDPADPNRPVSFTMPWYQGYEITLIPQTPGIYRVSINGVSVLAGEVHDYAGGGLNDTCQVARDDKGTCVPALQSVKDGADVRVEVTAQHATGPWLVEVRSKREGSSAHD
ncbi:hypothetical protein ACIBTV_30650 [Micromonospora sp. NPDC049366]|uniref:hypothetical protein n=1 Tax=Micromonospora sp. NPDC049366 TaxID=3364271 RepID=UPI0037967767